MAENGSTHRRVRVLHIITRLDIGGSTDNTILTILGLDREHYRVTLAHGLTEDPSKMVKRLEDADGVAVVSVPSLIRAIRPWTDLKALAALYRLIRRGRFDIVHTHSSKAGLLGRLAALAARTPAVIHTPHGHVFYGHFGPFTSWAFLWIEKILARWTRVIVALTEQGKQDHVSRGVGTDASVQVIHSGVELESFRQERTNSQPVKEEFGIPPQAPVVGMVGWLTPIKGPNTLVEAWPRVRKAQPDAVLLLVGDGVLRPQLEKRCRRDGTSGSVVFTGMREDVPRLMAAMDLVVLPSLNEGMGKVLVEAMALGKPLVASAVGGIPDLVQEGVNGLLVPPRDPESLARAINELLADPEKATRFGEAGRTIAPNFSAERMVEKIEEMYRRI